MRGSGGVSREDGIFPLPHHCTHHFWRGCGHCPPIIGASLSSFPSPLPSMWEGDPNSHWPQAFPFRSLVMGPPRLLGCQFWVLQLIQSFIHERSLPCMLAVPESQPLVPPVLKTLTRVASLPINAGKRRERLLQLPSRDGMHPSLHSGQPEGSSAMSSSSLQSWELPGPLVQVLPQPSSAFGGQRSRLPPAPLLLLRGIDQFTSPWLGCAEGGHGGPAGPDSLWDQRRQTQKGEKYALGRLRSSAWLRRDLGCCTT